MAPGLMAIGGVARAMSVGVKVPEPVHQKAKEIKELHDYATLGEAIRHMCREGGYDV